MIRNRNLFLGLLIILEMFIVPASAIPLTGSKEMDEKKSQFALDQSVESQKTISLPEVDGRQPKIVIQSTDNALMSLNLLDVDIREALSAIAMKLEINIVTATDVSGKISVHLYEVALDEALDAVTLAGGFCYHKHRDYYYVFRPKEDRDPQAARLQMRVFRLEYAEIEKVQEILDAIPGKRVIQIHEDSKCVIVEDIPENIKKVETILSFLDTPPRQVMIEAKILEVSLTDEMSLGVNWGQILGDARIATTGFSTATIPSATDPAVSPLPVTGTGLFGNIITGAGSRHQFTAALDALQTKTKIETLSTPKILAIHGKTARVQVGGEQGYKTTITNMGVTTEEVKFIDTGTILEIIPYIDDEGNVLLNVKPDIKSAKIEGGVPVVMTTGVSTWLLAKSRETVFIAGLIKDEGTKTREMVPCIGNVPMLGWFFRHTSQKTGKSELVVLITPHVVKTELKRLDQEAIEKTKEVQEKLNREPLPPHKEFLDFP